MPTRCPGRRRPSRQGDDNRSKSWHLSTCEGTGNRPDPPLPSARLPSRCWPAWEANQTPGFPDEGLGLPRPRPHARCPGTLPAAPPRRTLCGVPGTPTWAERGAAQLTQPGPQGPRPSSHPPFCPRHHQVGRALPRGKASLPLPLAKPKLRRRRGAETQLTAESQQPRRRHGRGRRAMARWETAARERAGRAR